MSKTSRWMLTLLALLSLGVSTRAQETRDTSRLSGPAVTISITDRGVRFVALGSFGKMRLEVFDAEGTSLYNSDFGTASVRDWALDTRDGRPLPDGSYLCLITTRDLSGKLSTKEGTVLIQEGRPSFKLPDGERVEGVEQDKSLARIIDPPNTRLTLINHDGENGEVVNTQGALTFRFGDFFGGKDQELMRLTPDGNLGLGVKSPRAKLDVAGTIRAGAIEFPNGTVQTTGLSGRTDGQGNVVPATAGSGTQNKLAKWTDNAGTLGDSVVTELTGNIGIGTTSPSKLLDVRGASGTDYSGTVKLTTVSGTQFGISLFNPSTPNAFTSTAVEGFNGDAVSTNFGGMITEWSDVVGGLVLVGNASAVKNRPAISFNANQGKEGITRAAIQFDAAKSDGAGGVTALTGSNWVYDFRNNGTSQLLINGAGNVGIATNNPQSTLDVNGSFNLTGNATISGNIAAKYQDIAEWTSARTKLPSGTVVSLDTLKPNSVMASTKAYDTRVAGVVSAQPGVILGEGGPNRVLVATTGRVKVRVNAMTYPIHIGDLLVTSDTPGVAMKSQPFCLHKQRMHRPGTIIGKALEPLAGGKGEILVLLSLQ